MRVFDCFTFFNEFELLELRLNELSPVVDKFVISESTRTHQGKEKPLFFNENRHRFTAFNDKIIHVIVDRFPANEDEKSWIYERHQRDMLKEGLKECRPDDVIVVSDVDELPRPDKINSWKATKGIKIFEQNMYYYYLNLANTTHSATEYRWYGTAMAFFREYHSPQFMRDVSILVLNKQNAGFKGRLNNILSIYNQPEKWFLNLKIIQDGGWHFSYLGGAEKIITKIEAFAHQEYNKDEFKNPDLIKQRISAGQDIFGRNFTYARVPIDAGFPDYLTRNLDKFSSLICS